MQVAVGPHDGEKLRVPAVDFIRRLEGSVNCVSTKKDIGSLGQFSTDVGPVLSMVLGLFGPNLLYDGV